MLLLLLLQKPRAIDFSSSGRLAYSTSLSHSALMLRSIEEFTETKVEETDAQGTCQLPAAFASQVQQLDGLIRQQCWADICTLQLQQMERQQHKSESEDREVWSALLDTLNGVSFYFLLHAPRAVAGAGCAIA